MSELCQTASDILEIADCHEICDRILTMCPQVSLDEVRLLRWRATGAYDSPKNEKQLEMACFGDNA